MTRRLVTSLVLLAAACIAPVRAQPSNDMLPSGRTYDVVREGERNPFGLAISIEQPVTIEEAESEEARIRRIVAGLKVSGISEKDGRVRVLLGSMALGEGDRLPPLIRNQLEMLKVSKIEDNRLLLAFIERDASTDARVIAVPLAIEPKVNQFLFGEAFEKLANLGDRSGDENEIPVKGVEDFLKGSADASLQNVTSRKFQMMGEVRNEKADPKTP